MVQRVFRGRPGSPGLALAEVHEVPAAMSVAMLLLAAAVVGLGIHPQWLDPLLARAAGR
jgi:formate hydrogenlyase subunit 3/multisubunit Na+/H+ antiporter MnhD subunit